MEFQPVAMAEPSALEARIRQVFRDKLKLDVPSVDTDLFETAALDSMVFVDLLLHLEREFGVTVALEDIEFDHFRSIERIAEFVANRVAWAEGTVPPAQSEPVHRGRPEGVT
jgi:acyl carrier protein